MNRRYLLDASALLALLRNEAGADQVQAVLDDSAITAVNMAEVARKLLIKGVPPEDMVSALDGLDLDQVTTLGGVQVYAVGRVAAANRAIGLALGDAVCLVMAGSAGMTAVTADRAWKQLEWPFMPGVPQPELLVVR